MIKLNGAAIHSFHVASRLWYGGSYTAKSGARERALCVPGRLILLHFDA